MLQLFPTLCVYSFSRVLLTQFQFSLFKTHNKEKKISNGGLFVFIWYTFWCSIFMWPFPTSSLKSTQYQCTRSCSLPNTAQHHCQSVFWPSWHTDDRSWQHCFHLLAQLERPSLALFSHTLDKWFFSQLTHFSDQPFFLLCIYQHLCKMKGAQQDKCQLTQTFLTYSWRTEV